MNHTKDTDLPKPKDVPTRPPEDTFKPPKDTNTPKKDTGWEPAWTDVADPAERAALAKALDYMAIEPGVPLAGKKIDVVFIGSCTNSRLSDLRAAASVFRGRRVAAGVRALVVPGSVAIKREAEREGLDKVFLDAGAEWREPGCSMCIAMNGDRIASGQYAVSTSNRNFEGRIAKSDRD